MKWCGFDLPIQARVRVSEMPIPATDSVRQVCARCRSSVWSDRLTWESWLGRVGTVLCVTCVDDLTRQEMDGD